MSLQAIITDKAPRAIGPYSQAIRAGDFLFVSGQIPLAPESGELVDGGIEAQTHRVLQNIRAILNAAGLDMQHVVRADIFLTDLTDFADMNRVYEGYFPVSPQPVRQTVQVTGLPRGSRIEISCIACCV